MGFFKKTNTETIDLEKIKAPVDEVPTPEPEEEWIWVEGYKGTDRNMCCRGFQFEVGSQYDMPEDQEIEVCRNGFHLCLSFLDVLDYYSIGQGNRFFKVKALVRKTDKINYRGAFRLYNDYYRCGDNNKLTSKSIIFLSELSIDEILKDTDAQNLPEDYKKMAIDTSIKIATDEYHINTLLEDGYSKPFAAHIIKTDKFDIAHAFGSQKDLSMDMKVLGILYQS